MLYRLDELLFFFRRVGIVKTQIAAARIIVRDTKIQDDRLGMSDMQITVWLGWKAGMDRLVLTAIKILLDDLANKIR